MRLPWSSEGLCVFLKADRRKPKENAPQIQTCDIKGAALADRKFAIVCPRSAHLQIGMTARKDGKEKTHGGINPRQLLLTKMFF